MLTHEFFTDEPNLKHGFFTRLNGFSDGIYSSLNMGLGSNDNPDTVLKNYAYVKETLGLEHLLTLKQIHSNKVITVTTPWDIQNRPEGDAMVTHMKNIGLGVLTADCGPLLLADKENDVVGCVHLGRKGILSGLLENTLEAMEALGANRNYIHAVLGATISKDNYEVGKDVYDDIYRTMPEYDYHLYEKSEKFKYHLDIVGMIADLCDEADIEFSALNRCTYGEPDLFFSYRHSVHKKEADYGRLISVIALS